MQDQKASINFIEVCYQLYEQKMYQAAYRILHDSGLAEDAVQNAFLKLMQCNVYFDNPKSDGCKRYMITVIRHASIDIYNKKKKERETVSRFDDVSVFTNTPVQTEAENAAQVKELIQDLPAKYYAVVNCLAVKNLSVKETAQELGITDTAVRKRYQRAKRMLKTMQKGCDGHETAGNLYRSNLF